MGADIKRKTREQGLEIEEDLAFEKRDWVVQRVAWVGMVAIVLAALGGLLGPGPLTQMTADGQRQQISVEYHRFERSKSPAELSVRVQTAASQEVRLWVASDYLEAIELQQITPQPVRTESSADRTTFVFALSRAAEPTQIVFRFQFDRFGSREARLGIPGGDEVEFKQFVYP